MTAARRYVISNFHIHFDVFMLILRYIATTYIGHWSHCIVILIYGQKRAQWMWREHNAKTTCFEFTFYWFWLVSNSGKRLERKIIATCSSYYLKLLIDVFKANTKCGQFEFFFFNGIPCLLLYCSTLLIFNFCNSYTLYSL